MIFLYLIERYPVIILPFLLKSFTAPEAEKSFEAEGDLWILA